MIVAGSMICAPPTKVGKRLKVSADDGIWNACRELSDDLRAKLTDEFGRPNPKDTTSVHFQNEGTIAEVADLGLVTCLRAIYPKFLSKVAASVPDHHYSQTLKSAKFAGWDICSGNAWVSASHDGLFPVDPISGAIKDRTQGMVNGNCLISSFENCHLYVDRNNLEIHEQAPWFPVGVIIPQSAFRLFDGELTDLPSL